jgi:hypothetical protein
VNAKAARGHVCGRIPLLRLCNATEVEEWAHDGRTYQINSMYLVSESAWTYELTGPRGESDAVIGLAVVIPDETPDGERFTPAGMIAARVAIVGGLLPWPVLMRFTTSVEATGDIVSNQLTGIVTGDLALSSNAWRFEDRVFEVNSYHDGERDGWCYELCEVDPTRSSNDYIDVRIPDLQPDGGPFLPAAAREVVFAGRGSPTLPWPVLRYFLDAIAASGDIVEEQD